MLAYECQCFNGDRIPSTRNDGTVGWVESWVGSERRPEIRVHATADGFFICTVPPIRLICAFETRAQVIIIRRSSDQEEPIERCSAQDSRKSGKLSGVPSFVDVRAPKMHSRFENYTGHPSISLTNVLFGSTSWSPLMQLNVLRNPTFSRNLLVSVGVLEMRAKAIFVGSLLH